MDAPVRNGKVEPAAAVEQSLFEIRKKIYPRAGSGTFAAWRWIVVLATQRVFYGTPWLTWNDRQAVLFDLASHKFYIFGLVFWPQDIVYLTVLLIISAYSLFLFTAMANAMYPFHRQLGDPAYTDYVSYSRDVPVFRTDEGELLDNPWFLSIVTCAAVNARRLAEQAPDRLPLIRPIMAERTRKVLFGCPLPRSLLSHPRSLGMRGLRDREPPHGGGLPGTAVRPPCRRFCQNRVRDH